MSSTKKQLVILISGSGSNLQAFIDQCASGELNAEIACVVSNKATAFGLERATKAGIPTLVIDHTAYTTREAFDKALAMNVKAFKPDLVILAGFMRILTPVFVEVFAGKLLNIHPSLLPKYTGLNTHQRAIDAGDQYAGVTVHFVTPELDGGPPVLQAKIAINAQDNAATLAKKVLAKEHIIYPLAASWFLDGRLLLLKDNAYLDNQKLPDTGYQYEA